VHSLKNVICDCHSCSD